MGLVMANRGDEARTTADGLIEAAESTGNPWSLSYALLAYGFESGMPTRSAHSTPCAGVW